MALTDEQRAMLQLLLEGGQGYDDIASLLGIPPDEVRSRAKSALREMGGADPDAQVGLSDYLLGQADPIGRADAVRQLQSDPETNALANRLVTQLRLLAPRADLPEIPAPRDGGRRAAPPPPPPPPAAAAAPGGIAPPPEPASSGGSVASRAAGALSGLGSMSKRQTQLAIGLGALLIVAVIAVIVATGSGGSSSSSDCPKVDASKAQQAGVPSMTLAPPANTSTKTNGCPATGQVTLGSSGKQFIVQINASDLPPTSGDQQYVVWLYKSDSEASPLARQTVDQSGNLTGQIPLTAQQLALTLAFTQIRVSLTSQAALTSEAQQIQQQGKKATGFVPFIGQPELEGNIADLGLQQLLQQAQAQAQQQGKSGSGKTGAGAGSTK